LVGDYGGGGMYLAFGVACALFEARESGHGQVVDVAMVDGAASLMTSTRWQVAAGRWTGARGENRLDSGAPFYDVYRTADGRFVSVGAPEPQFYAGLRTVLDLSDDLWEEQDDRSRWPRMRQVLTELFATKTRAQWCAIFDSSGIDACFAPVMSVDEAPRDVHNRARGTFNSRDGVSFVGPAPRLSRTPGRVGAPFDSAGGHSAEILAEFGFDEEEIEQLRATGAIS
jgi:alpha-methylacyl-CoA racemase